MTGDVARSARRAVAPARGGRGRQPGARRRRAARARARHHPRRASRWSTAVARRAGRGVRRAWWRVAPAREPLQHLTGTAALPLRRARRWGRGSSCPRPETELLAGWAVEQRRRLVAAGREPGRRRPVHRLGRDRAGGGRPRCRAPRARRRARTSRRRRLGRAQPRRRRASTSATATWPTPSTTSTAPSTWWSATRRTSRSTPTSRWRRRPATTTRTWRCSPATTGSTRCASLERVAARLLRPGGVVGAEHADVQGESAPAVFAATGRWSDVRDHRDLAGRARFATARLARDGERHWETDRESPRYRTTDRRPSARPAREAAALAVQRGQLVVLPTDTVYGVGADAFDPDAVARPARRQGPRPRDAAAGAGRRPRPRSTRWPSACPATPARWSSELLARPADPGLPPAAVAAVGPRRHPRHGRGADARPRGRPRAARAAPARSPSAAPTCTGRPAATDADAGRGDARGVGRGHPRRRPDAAGAEPSTIVDVTGAQGRVLRLGALSPRAAQRGRSSRSASDDHRRGLTAGRARVPPRLPGRRRGHLPAAVVAREIALRTGAVAQVRDRDVHAVPIPYFGGVAMLGGLVAAYLVARQLPFLSRATDHVFHDAAVVLGRRRDDLRARGARRPLRARRADQARRPGAGRRASWSSTTCSTSPSSLPGGGTFIARPGPGGAAQRRRRRRDRQRGELRRRPRRAGRRRGRASARSAFFVFAYQLADANDESLAITAALLCAALAGACVGLPAAQLLPGPDLHGRLRLDADRPGAGRLGAHADRPVRAVDMTRAPAARRPACCRRCCRSSCRSRSCRAVRRPGARGRPAHPGRAVAVRARQAAPAPPAAGDRPLPPPRGADHVAVGRPDRASGECWPASTRAG